MKKLIIGLVVGLLIGLSANAFAAISDTVTATFANFNYVVNGTAQPPGVTALVYDGTSYLKTTQIANMLGYDVTYKADTRTIEFNKPVSSPTPTPAAATLAPAGSPTPTPTGATPTPAPTPVGQTPSPTPVATATPTPNPSATPAPTSSVAPTPTPYVGPTNEQMLFCQQYRMDPDIARAHGCP